MFDESMLTKRQQVAQQGGQAPSPNASQTPPPSSTGLTLIDVHGILMIIAWLALVAVAVYSARYMRSVWANTTIMGLKIWFHIHRTLNFVAVCLIVLSSVLVFIKIGMWRGPWFGETFEYNTRAGAWHSLAGIIGLVIFIFADYHKHPSGSIFGLLLLTVVLALMQPFGALFRCGIDDPKRPLFNWAHRSAGIVAITLASVALFIAVSKFTRHFKFAESNVAFWVLVGFFVCMVSLVVMSEVLRLTEMRQQSMIQSIEMKVRNRDADPRPSDTYYYQQRQHTQTKLASSRKILFVFISVLCTTVALVLIILILSQ